MVYPLISGLGDFGAISQVICRGGNGTLTFIEYLLLLLGFHIVSEEFLNGLIWSEEENVEIGRTNQLDVSVTDFAWWE